MTASDGGPASRGSATLPTEQIPAVRRDEPRRSEPVELPEIVPATSDDADTSSASSTSPSVRDRPAPRPTLPAVRPPSPAPTSGDADRDPADGWVDDAPPPVVVPAPSTVPGSPLRVVGRRPRVRKVTRVVRHLDPWSVFKVSAIFSVVFYGVALTSGVLLWNVALSTGTVDNVERWFTQFGWETFELDGGEIYHNAWIGGLFGAVALTGIAVLVATLFNLVSDMVGGVRVTVLEEEVVERSTSPAKRYVVRRMPSDPAGSSPGATPARSPAPTTRSPAGQRQS